MCRFLIAGLPVLALLAGCGGLGAPAGGAAAAPAARPAAVPEGKPPAGMVRIPGGTFMMGTDESPFPYETPAHEVTVDPFYIDVTEVTNAQFARFVAATHYVTS